MPSALRVTSQTLLGIGETEFPFSRGNCFSVEANDGKYYRIVNFCVENFHEMLKRGITIPVKLEVLCLLEGDGVAVINDERIPDNWYSDRFCECCCPKDLLPFPQQLSRQREIVRGELVEHKNGVCAIDRSKRPRPLYRSGEEPPAEPLRLGWIIHETVDDNPAFVNEEALKRVSFGDDEKQSK